MAKTNEFKVGDRVFKKDQRVYLQVPWPDGRVTTSEGFLDSIHKGKAYIMTRLGLVEGEADTLEPA
jgi:hypothetical protein